MSTRDDLLQLRQPIRADQPCGRSLEGTPLLAAIDATRRSTPPDWVRLREQALDALTDSKDLRVLASLAAALLHTDGLEDSLQTLRIAADWLDAYWADVFPRLDQRDTSLRRQALEAFNDVEADLPAFAKATAVTQVRPTTDTDLQVTTDALQALGRIATIWGKQAGSDVPNLEALERQLARLSGRELPDAHRSAADPPVNVPPAPKRTRGLRRAKPPEAPPAVAAPVPRGGPMPPLPPAAPPSRTRSIPAPAAPQAAEAAAPAAVVAESAVECHIQADMDPEVVVDRTATIEITVSREMLAPLAGRASATSAVSVDASSRLLVQVMPRLNFVLADPAQDRVDIPVPAAGAPALLYFDVKGAHAGPGEIWIVVRQHQMGIARLELKPTVVERLSPVAAPRAVAAADATGAPPLVKPLDQLSIFEQTVGDTVKYVFELELPSINVLGLYESPPLKGNREEYIAALYKEIEDRYVSTMDPVSKAADVAAFTAELRAYGAVLFDQLFPREVQDLLWTHRDEITSVRVVSTEPFIPWEIVHLRKPGQALDPGEPPRFLGQMGLVRWLHNVNGLPPTTLHLREGRVRYVIPKYPDPEWQLPATVNERVYLEQTFAGTAIEPQPNPVRDALAEPGSFDLLHFACHGEADSHAIAQARLVLEGRMEGQFVPSYLNAAIVESFGRLRSPDGAQPIVFLNACQAGRAGYQLTGIGGFAQAFLRAGAGAFVGTLWSVGDQPAFYFGKAFYDTLRRGSTVAEAAIAAREAARQDDATWLAYVVYGHPHGRVSS
jgi:predicted component of type VI protein secretion system